MKKEEHVIHTFGPVYDENSEILILGSMPSVKSREQQFYYGHPQNRFWKVLAAVFEDTVPNTTEEKRKFLLKKKIALWDVIESCDITGSSDSSIKNVKENDMSVILDRADIRAVFVNGGKAHELFVKYCRQYIDGEGKPKLIKLPSTSPANAAWSLERLTNAWRYEIAKVMDMERLM
ncbi:MAG: DNA-deoxyinosine glycosylase [Lachnospiraceae bacterium]|nr:DNA-deoxyinosine glycosylase [Lachnospiraceae bacterium]